ncbi:Xanthine phosphoribosyltransferase [Methanimicrococcus sp. At1]|uniref:Hypoxanthine/guanine phosphoribosyltransferase n=1 Tax=Methanimicrococcus hacksteinii TaxID=3028293 RepID=A0ABU3VNP8_9EURY|nr:hypoxanthine/guanine phosphoribosyltransferase [Methanimicrococcus sp. At1]MDV0445039.1 Xanthine phosphoribosyltransferase [Methanimicrococcus sp. At1]
MLEKLKKSLEEAPVIQKESEGQIYNYFIHPISDGIPETDPAILEEIADFIIAGGKTGGIDKIVTVEAMGIPIATALSLKTGIPVSIIRKRKYGLDGEVELSQSTGYSKGTLFINGLSAGDRILIVDDVISTGGTLLPLLETLGGMGVDVAGVYCVIGRGAGTDQIKEKTGVDIVVLVDIAVSANGVTVVGGV